jgi:hypothetical protein
VDQPSVHVFETIRFLANALDLVNLDVPSFQESEGLPFARPAKGISTLCFRMKLVFGKNIPISLDANGLSCSVAKVDLESLMAAD